MAQEDENKPVLMEMHGLLQRIDERTSKMDDRYAKKWVERAFLGVTGIFGTAVAIVTAKLFQGGGS